LNPCSFELLLPTPMLPKLSILLKAGSAITMMIALCFLTTANFWVYGIQQQKQAAASMAVPAEEEQDSGSTVPNPVEEKNANALQNLSEYLHDNHHSITHPAGAVSFGNRHDFIKLPIHHPELLTPPPKQLI
jgi:hypothetical protein